MLCAGISYIEALMRDDSLMSLLAYGILPVTACYRLSFPDPERLRWFRAESIHRCPKYQVDDTLSFSARQAAERNQLQP